LVDWLPGFWEMPDFGYLSDDFVSFLLIINYLFCFLIARSLPGHCPMIARWMPGFCFSGSLFYQVKTGVFLRPHPWRGCRPQAKVRCVLIVAKSNLHDDFFNAQLLNG